jgi:hypothetical protein
MRDESGTHMGARVGGVRAGAWSEGCVRSVGAGLVGPVRWLTGLISPSH